MIFSFLLSFIVIIILPLSVNDQQSADVETENLVTFLALVANDQVKKRSDVVKLKFHRCIEKAAFSPQLYARCLFKLMGSRKTGKTKRGDELVRADVDLAHDISLIGKWKHPNVIPKQESFTLLNDPMDNSRSTQFIENLVNIRNQPPRFPTDKTNNTLNHVSNFFQYISELYQKSKLALYNTTDGPESPSLKILSPRFLTLESEDRTANNETINILSPGIFSLRHTAPNVNNILPIAPLLDKLPQDERELWRQFIAQVAATIERDLTLKIWGESIDALLKEYGLDDEAVRRSVQRFFDTLDQRQLHNLNTNGFTSIEDYQLHLIDDDYKQYKYRRVSDSVMQRALHAAVKSVADGVHNGHRRVPLTKGCVLKSSVGKTMVFRHFVVSYVVLCPATLGSFVLGAFVLTPYVLSPFLLYPFILAPFTLTPFVLSPFALSPIILAPAVLSPFILSPNVLSPTILSPVVLTPTILSPRTFSPIILSPSVLNPAILSPGSFSPFVLSPCVLCG